MIGAATSLTTARRCKKCAGGTAEVELARVLLLVVHHGFRARTTAGPPWHPQARAGAAGYRRCHRGRPCDGGIRRSSQREPAVAPGDEVAFTATAYCGAGTTKSGVRTRSGIAAADPVVLPVGSVVRLRSPEEPRYEGIYTVMDTGSAVQGPRIDLFISSCREAREFGLKRVLVQVLRHGWNPRVSAPSRRAP